MRYTYLVINAFIIFVPLLYSVDRRIRYYRCFPALVLAIAVVGLPYLVWDGVVTAWGEWSFNARYVTGVKIVNLPVEEILFFVTVPYSCIFIYESLAYYTKNRPLRLPVALFVLLGCGLAVGAVIVRDHGYAMKALVSCAAVFLFGWMIKRDFMASSHHWIWLGICYIPFLLINGVLTALPVVRYNPEAILGPRVGTIPIEDFFYNFSMLSFYGLFYVLFKDLLGVRQHDRTYGIVQRDKAILGSGAGPSPPERWYGR